MKLYALLGSFGVVATLALTPLVADAHAGPRQASAQQSVCFQEDSPPVVGDTFRTLDTAPARVSPSRACPSKVHYSADSSVSITCKVTNNHKHVWYRTADGYNIYSGHFARSVKDKVDDCITD